MLCELAYSIPAARPQFHKNGQMRILANRKSYLDPLDLALSLAAPGRFILDAIDPRDNLGRPWQQFDGRQGVLAVVVFRSLFRGRPGQSRRVHA